jgi:flagellar biosynthesis protein FlhF
MQIIRETNNTKAIIKDCDLFNVTAAATTKSTPELQSQNVLNNFKTLLQACGLEGRFCNSLLEHNAEQLTFNGNINLDIFAKILGEYIQYGYNFKNYPEKIAFLGASGVGKTATIAKFANLAKTQFGKKVALITLDNQKLFNARHLGQVGEMLDVPAYLVRNAKDLILTFNELHNFNLILIDTVGCSNQQIDIFRQNNNLLEHYNTTQLTGKAKIKKILLLPAGNNVFDLKKTIQTFSEFKLSGLGITKTDETCYFGPCVNAILQHNLPLNLITGGLDIFNNLEINSEVIAKEVVKLLFQGR